MNEKFATDILSALGNKDLSMHWNKLDSKQKQNLYLQLQKLDLTTLDLQKKLLEEPQAKNLPITPFLNYSKIGNPNDRLSGKKMISKGCVGCVIVAGGQGSRLHIEGPKGLCQVTSIRKKSLFQLFAEKIKAASKQAQRLLPLAIMTSPLNHEETIVFFEKNHFFDLEPQQLAFFQQEMLPLLDQSGNVFLETPISLSQGPDGNGGALHQFFKCGLWESWYSQGVRYLNFLPIDNPLADPFDAELIGFQQRQNSDIAIKCVERKNPQENVGTIVQINEKAAVIEYSELSQVERSATNADGSLCHLLANLSLFSFEMEFIKHVAKNTSPRLHKAFKAVKFLNQKGQTFQAKHPMAWKFEKFIFDLLPLASKVDALLYPREACFAPLKNINGNDSFESVAKALEYSDQQILSAITGLPVTLSPLEISQEFYYPTLELLEKWKERTVNRAGYIDAF